MQITNQFNDPRVKKHVLIIVLGLFLGLSLYYYFDTSISLEETSNKFIELVLSAIGGVALAYLTYFVSLKLDKLFPWKTQLVNRFLSGIIFTFVLNFIMTWLFVQGYLNSIQNSSLDYELLKNNWIKLGIILFILMLIYTIIYFALYSYYSYSKLQIETIAYERKQYELQFKALKSQLSSHFLFNNLNTISSLAFKDTNQAETYIRGLAKIYNYTLSSYHAKLVTIKEELDVIKAYLSLLSSRFGKVLSYSIDVSETNMRHFIPPLTLQMLIENAVKHNQASESIPLNIKIREEDDTLVVINNITKAPDKVSSFNIGLNNINARFQLIYKKEISVSKDTNYSVKIPIIFDE